MKKMLVIMMAIILVPLGCTDYAGVTDAGLDGNPDASSDGEDGWETPDADAGAGSDKGGGDKGGGDTSPSVSSTTAPRSGSTSTTPPCAPPAAV
jgi:hypothetical protein